MEEISALKFPVCRHLGFHGITAFPYCFKRRTSAFHQQRQCSYVMKSKMAARGKFKSQNIIRLLLLINATFPFSGKICN